MGKVDLHGNLLPTQQIGQMILGKSSRAACRRVFLVRGLGAGIATLLPLPLADFPLRVAVRGKVGDIGDAVVPATLVNLADYGGTPGAASEVLVAAFMRAFAALAETDGGTLFVPAGVYDFGAFAQATDIILCRNVRNIAISAYGATFTATTTANVVSNMFYFFNFKNITIAGASFVDTGFSPWVEWKGMYCVGIQADKMSSGFTMVDCYAERVVGLLASNNNASTRNYLSHLRIAGEVRNSYYGVAANYVREKVKVELVCHNVRRAFIAYALKDADIRVTSRNTSVWPGSNGLIALVSSGAGAGNVEHVRINVDISGEGIHSSYVHFYHQGPQSEGYMRDIDATVNVTNLSSAQNLFVFDHEIDGVRRQTSRVWDRISLHGMVTGEFDGRVVSNPSVTTAPGTVYLDPGLARLGKQESLASSFRVRRP